jgi:hypothetical protein
MAPMAPVPPAQRTMPIQQAPPPASITGVMQPAMKKETVRIQTPVAAKVPPQATIRIQQTQPLVRRPEAQVRTLAAASTQPTALVQASDGSDTAMLIVSLCVLVFAAVTLTFQALTYFSN